jgi:hypothetical protein
MRVLVSLRTTVDLHFSSRSSRRCAVCGVRGPAPAPHPAPVRRPRLRPRELHGQVRALQITPRIARRGTEHGSDVGAYRWVVEGSIALLHWFRRLRIRWEIRDDIHQAFLTLGRAIIFKD